MTSSFLSPNHLPFHSLFRSPLPGRRQEQEAVCRVYEEDFDKLLAFINTAVPEAVQDGSPTSDQARWQGIYIHTPAFIVTTIAGQDGPMGPEARFSRVVDAPAGPRRASAAAAGRPVEV
jgi:hypothetical protein